MVGKIAEQPQVAEIDLAAACELFGSFASGARHVSVALEAPEFVPVVKVVDTITARGATLRCATPWRAPTVHFAPSRSSSFVGPAAKRFFASRARCFFAFRVLDAPNPAT